MGPRWLLDSVDSTQALAVEHIRGGGAPNARFVARTQDGGRGRLDHAWSSPHGGLYLSMVVPEPEVGGPLVPLGVGAMVGTGIEGRFGVSTVLKWPNDLLVVRPPHSPRKLVGILVDRVEGPTGASLAIGVGVNVASRRADFSEALRDHVAILADYVRTPPSLDEVESAVVDAVDQVLDLLRTDDGRARLLGACRSALYGVGHRALVDGRPAGVIRAIGDDGALWLEDGRERVSVRAGSVAVVEGT